MFSLGLGARRGSACPLGGVCGAPVGPWRSGEQGACADTGGNALVELTGLAQTVSGRAKALSATSLEPQQVYRPTKMHIRERERERKGKRGR